MRIRKSAQDRKREAVQAALQLAFKVGPAQVTTGMIATELGITQPAIYKHFPRKDDIWAAVAQHLSQRIAQNIARANEMQLAPDAYLKTLVLGHLQVIKENPALPEFMILRDTKDGHIILQDTIQAAISAFRIALETNVKTAVKNGIFRATLDAKDATTLIFGVIQSL
ncbi:MAG: TetR/AcrR family transcriptional regulator, partial [Marinosulfonomonas sp.]|nr:TetR/AcrR family transcriptional regulator [Marinosulfonomonas sp.]